MIRLTKQRFAVGSRAIVHAHIVQLEGAIGDVTFEDPLAVIRFGYAEEPLRDPNKIHRRTGQVSWKDGLTVDNPNDIWSFKPIEWTDDINRST